MAGLSLIERVKGAMGHQKKSAIEGYVTLLGQGDDADERELLKVAQDLGKGSEQIEADAVVIREDQQLLAASKDLDGLKTAADLAHAACFRLDDEHRRRLLAVEVWYETQAGKVRGNFEAARRKHDRAARAAMDLAALRADHPDLLG